MKKYIKSNDDQYQTVELVSVDEFFAELDKLISELDDSTSVEPPVDRLDGDMNDERLQ